MNKVLRECSFVPVNEPWTCSVHGGIRTRLDEPQCDRVKPAEPFNDAYLDNLRQSIAEGHYPQGLYNCRRLLATIDALRAALAEAAPPSDDGKGSRDLDFIRECVARNPGGYTSEFRFLLDTVNRLEAAPPSREALCRCDSDLPRGGVPFCPRHKPPEVAAPRYDPPRDVDGSELPTPGVNLQPEATPLDAWGERNAPDREADAFRAGLAAGRADPREGREYSAVVHGIPRLDPIPHRAEAAPPSRVLDPRVVLDLLERGKVLDARAMLRAALSPTAEPRLGRFPSSNLQDDDYE